MTSDDTKVDTTLWGKSGKVGINRSFHPGNCAPFALVATFQDEAARDHVLLAIHSLPKVTARVAELEAAQDALANCFDTWGLPVKNPGQRLAELEAEVSALSARVKDLTGALQGVLNNPMFEFEDADGHKRCIECNDYLGQHLDTCAIGKARALIGKEPS